MGVTYIFGVNICGFPEKPHTNFLFYSRKNHHIGESRFVRDETLFGLVIIVIKVLFRLVFIDAVLHLIPFILI